MGFKESVAAKIDEDTRLKIEEMEKKLSTDGSTLIDELLNMVYDIKPQLHRNYDLQINGLPTKGTTFTQSATDGATTSVHDDAEATSVHDEAEAP